MSAGTPREAAAEAANGRLVREFGLLLRAAARLEQRVNAALRDECGISHVMFEVLMRLCRNGDEQVSQRTLADDLVLTSGGITRLIDRMEEADLVRRLPSPNDRRVTLVEPTPHGVTTFLRAADVHARTLRRHFVAPMADAERAHVVGALERIDAALLADTP
ncbi:MarR family transcriptional regulator [Streptomyces griseocarneus]|nr:MarR family transcriptional regulator [Streptomyces griseocarneus]